MARARVAALAVLVFLTAVTVAFAAEAELSAVPNATEITEKENLSIELTTTVNAMAPDIGDVEFDAPDFSLVNSYGRAQGVSSTLVDGKLTVQRTQSAVAVLVPKKIGQLKISNIRVVVDGKTVRAKEIVIDVKPEGSMPRQGSGQTAIYPGQRRLPRNGLQQDQTPATTFFLRTEPSKLKVYKGEQVLLTYALYTRVRMLNVQVERYPTVTGFLKEDIDIPLLRGRLDYSHSVVEGHAYQRAVLAQYAIFPVNEGLLPVDTFTGKFSYQGGLTRLDMDDDDPFSMFNKFFQSMQATQQSKSSNRVSIEVLPLPAAGRPAGFSGLVGDFDLTAVVDKYQVKVGEPINIKVKIEGKGHAGSLESLEMKFPADFELYEDKSRTQFMRSGHSERIFEYMLVPKTKGRFEIPALEVSMFDPDAHTYKTKSAPAIQIEVAEGSLGNVYLPKTSDAAGATKTESRDIRYWMSETPTKESRALGVAARGALGVSVVVAALALILLGGNGKMKAQGRSRREQELKARAMALVGAKGAPGETLGAVEACLAQMLELKYGVSLGSLTRPALREALAERGVKDDEFSKRVESLLELCENARYVPGGGDDATADRAARELSALLV